MEIDEHLKYTLYVSPTQQDVEILLLTRRLPACNSTRAHAPVNPWFRAVRRTTSCEMAARKAKVRESERVAPALGDGRNLCMRCFIMRVALPASADRCGHEKNGIERRLHERDRIMVWWFSVFNTEFIQRLRLLSTCAPGGDMA